MAAAILAASTLSDHAFHISIGFAEEGKNAVLCVIKDVTVLAEKAGDCDAIGGMTSHEVTPVAK
ncbi:hypothetical protein [Antarctobacter heliothermus]|uniref:hypothetical protein n=1 Tax=Antarctobacter heliothermus TaxID=74033 RepID=UPI000B8BC186|nr:hypothetical protein [Antarctobacter heliothermus]